VRAACRFCGLVFIGPRCYQVMADHTWECPESEDFRLALFGSVGALGQV
jgi:hypothetical protein